MATIYHYDLYPRTDPRDGTRLVRFSSLQKATYRDVMGVGSGVGILRSTHADADFLDPLGEQYVRVVEDTDAVEAVVGGFWISDVKHQTAVRRETRKLTVAGPGIMAYLARASMAPHTYLDTAIGQDPYDDLWRLWAQGPVAGGDHLGAVLWRVIYEAQHFRVALTQHRHADGLIYTDSHADSDRIATAIPDVVLGFDAFDDSDGNAWTLPSGEFTARVGENLLSVVQRLMQAGLYVEMDPDTFELRAWEGRPASRGGRSTNRTGSAWGANVVRFQSPTDGTIETGNIKSDTESRFKSFLRRTLVWAGGGNVYAKATGTSDVLWEGFEGANLQDVPGLQQLASNQLNAREEAADAVDPKMKLGDDPEAGKYRPWQEVRIDELVTVHTGAGTWDFDERTFPVAGLRIELQKGGDWAAWAELGASFEAGRERRFEVPVPAAPTGLRLCDPTVPGGEDTELYHFHWANDLREDFTNADSDPDLFPESAGAVVDTDSSPGSLAHDPDSGHVNFTLSNTSDGGGPFPCSPGDVIRWEFDTRYGGGIDIRWQQGGSTISQERISTHTEGNVWIPRTATLTAPALTDNWSWIPIGAGKYAHVRIYDVGSGTETQNPNAGNSPDAARCDHDHPAEDHHHDDEYTPLGHSHLLGDLADVDLDPVPDDGDVIAYDAATDTWLPAAPGNVALSDDLPLVESGSGDEGTSPDASRSDHVHPADGGGGGAAYIGRVVSAAPIYTTPTTANVSNAGFAWAFPINIPGPMLLRGLNARASTGAAGTVTWGLFNPNANPAAAVKVAGGTGVMGAAGIHLLAAASAPVAVAAGTYMVILAMPSSTQPTIVCQSQVSVNASVKFIDPYTWDDTPDFTTGWADQSNLPLCWLEGDLLSGTQW